MTRGTRERKGDRGRQALRSMALALALQAVGCARADLDVLRARGGDDAAVPMPVRSAGCGKPAPARDTDQTIPSGASPRSYRLHVPPAYDADTPVPLVLDFHAISSTGPLESMVSPYRPLTDAEGVVSAFPNGSPGPLGPAWNIGPCCDTDPSTDDVGFARAVVTQVASLTCIDLTRVYAVGFSMGGGFAHYLGCHAADVFAAIAPAGFDLLQENVADCRPSRSITVLSSRGTADTFIPYGGGFSSTVPGMPVTFLGAQKTFQKWAELDSCKGPPSTPDANGCVWYGGCPMGVDVLLCSKPGGGPEREDATMIWPWLKAHRL